LHVVIETILRNIDIAKAGGHILGFAFKGITAGSADFIARRKKEILCRLQFGNPEALLHILLV